MSFKRRPPVPPICYPACEVCGGEVEDVGRFTAARVAGDNGTTITPIYTRCTHCGDRRKAIKKVQVCFASEMGQLL